MQKKKPVAVTIRSFGANPNIFDKINSRFDVVYRNPTGKHLSEDQLIQALHGVQGVIAGTERFNSTVIQQSPDLRVISRVGVGTDSIDMEAAEKAGIRVVNTPVAPASAVAEHTLALLLCIVKRICTCNADMRDPQKGQQAERGISLEGKVCGIVGMGRIGKKVAALIRAFGCSIIYYDPFVQLPDTPGYTRTDTLAGIFRHAEIISLHMPSLLGGGPVISKESLNECRDGVIIINTARGSLVDEDALITGLESGKIKALGLDVFCEEPYKGPLLDYPQVIATPHVASNTVESRLQMEDEAVQNLITALGGDVE